MMTIFCIALLIACVALTLTLVYVWKQYTFMKFWLENLQDDFNNLSEFSLNQLRNNE